MNIRNLPNTLLQFFVFHDRRADKDRKVSHGPTCQLSGGVRSRLHDSRNGLTVCLW